VKQLSVTRITFMLRRDYEGQNCSIARTLELIGERWTLLILRDVFLGTRRFDDLQRNLGVARNILQSRLERLVDEGVLRRVRYQERPERFEYRLTDKGRDLYPVIVSLMRWGDRWAADEMCPPIVLTHKACGHAGLPELTWPHCRESVQARGMRWRPREAVPRLRVAKSNP